MQVTGVETNGDGVDGRQLDIEFAPNVAIVKREEGISGGGVYIASTTMTEGLSKCLSEGNAAETNHIKSFTPIGITMGDDRAVNAGGSDGSPGGKFHWLFLAEGDDLAVGTYVGTGNDDEEITQESFTPDVAIVWTEEAQVPVFRVSIDTGDLTRYFEGGHGTSTNRIKALIPGGMRLGNHAEVNGSGITYHYVMWKNVPGIAQVFKYTGNATDNRGINGAGFQPDHAITRSNGTPNAHWKPVTIGASVDASLSFSTGGFIDDAIQELTADGMEIGTNSAVNTNTAVYAGFWLKHVLTTSVPRDVNQFSRLGLYGGPSQLYGSFTGKSLAKRSKSQVIIIG